jgi:predicted ATPase
MERIIFKMLQKDRELRYPSIAELLIDLRQFKQKLDYQEMERSFSPEQATLQMEHAVTESLEAVSSNFGGAISTKSSQILPPNNLTTELSTLIGRETEVAEIMNLLRRDDIRLVTITGVGGTGKTRLAKTIAHESLLEFTDGVYFVNLSAMESAELVIPTIAQILGLREERGSTLEEILREYLRERKILIVLDNFEQITSAAPQIGELLSGSLNLKILVTSRIRLQLRFEKEFTLAPLQVPSKENLSLSKLNQYPSVALFIERAQAVKSNFTLTESNAQSVAEICRQLDGLPLAIELAAVRVKLLAPQAILTRLSNSLKLLTGGARDLPERQQTMRATIAWSYDLLEAEEKTLLNRLAIFAGGFTLEGAEAVANAESDLSVDLLDGVASLVDKSLLLQREKADGEPWFRMLVVVREFALEALEASSEADQTKRLHAEYYTQMAEIFEPEFDGANAAEWLENLEQEHDNIRAAIEWNLENKPENALAIVGAIRSFWNRRGHLSEASKWLKQSLEKNGENADPKLLAKAFCALGDSIWAQGDSETAAWAYQESLRFARQIEDKYWISTALRGLGYIRRVEGNLSEAKQIVEESLELARELNDHR